MGLSKISNEELDNEKASIKKLLHCSDAFESVVFNSGAGSGKTYALVECLKHAIKRNRENLNDHNQKIACITYTNVAAEHIKQQVGVSDVVEISTIHKRIWNIICDQKKALLDLHIEKLKSEIENIDTKLAGTADYEKYRELVPALQENFFKIMCENKKEYNKAYNYKSKEFKDVLPEKIRLQYAGLLSNVTKFKGLVDKLFKRKRYLECLQKIENEENGYTVVNYDAMYNRDRLDKMRISHDTLLDYGYELVERYPRMKQLIIDHYPYILIDEYQDTAYVVVKTMNLIEQYAKEIKHDIFIAYFGDSVQNIYDTGVGKQLKHLHAGLVDVSKMYNRRSYTEIIDVANNVRNDEIVQKSIYSDSTGGSIKFYYGNVQDVNVFVNLCVGKWGIQNEEPIHCLFATNQMVAEYSGFLNVYNVFKNADVYKGIGCKQLNSELLSHDTIHLGKAQALLYRLMKLYTEVRAEKSPLRDILPMDDYRNMNFAKLRELVILLQTLDGKTIDELLVKIFEQYHVSNDKTYKMIIEKVFDVDEETSYAAVLKYLLISLYNSWNESIETKEIISSFLHIKVAELLNWFHYINRDEKKTICYHTFHSTKGLEYKNVIIILSKDFGVDRGLFEAYFKDYGKSEKNVSINFEKGRNILYVAVTRAIKNLRILYIDDLKEIQDNIETVFGKVYPFSSDTTGENL